MLTVTWAEPRKNDAEQEKVKSIYIGNLPDSVTEAKLKDIFKAYGEVERVVLPPGSDGHKFREYGFVHYTERACALKAIEASGQERPVLDGKELSVALAKPPTSSERRVPEFDGRRSMQPNPGSRGMAGGRGRPMTRVGGPRGMMGGYGETYDVYGGYEGYGGEYGYGGGYASGSYEMAGMSLVPMYLPNGQVGFVFQQQRMAPANPTSGGPMRKVPMPHSYNSGPRGDRGGGDYGSGSYGSYGSQRSQRGSVRSGSGSYGSYGSTSRGSGGSSRYRPY